MGTDGDIRPFIALAIALKKQNADVLMLVPDNGIKLCKKYNIPYVSIDFDYKDFVYMTENKAPTKDIVRVLDLCITMQFDKLAEVAKGADFIIGSAINYATGAIAEIYNIPYYQVWHVIQVLKSSQHPPWRVKRQNNPCWLNSLLWKINDLRDDGIGNELINKHREKLSLKPIKKYADYFRKNIILSADKSFVSAPEDVKEQYTRTDYWHLFEEEELSRELLHFINAGEPPIYFGSGSMADKSPVETVKMVKAIAEKLNTRMIIQKGWAGYDIIDSDRVFLVDSVPHHKLFCKMSVVIHHGGAGTTHTAASAGVPQLIIPNIADQFYWGKHVSLQKLGPSPIPKSIITVGKLEAAIKEAITNTEFKANAQRMGKTLKTRNSMEDIVKQLKII